ncbi:hypothetical protein SAMN05443287_11060 [Micromonospora phaseoli]|uniref:Uncharacterized protein n=1 Tax=Micromonospora phaseoli TaxID=1144548 RepID=A0A1H7CPG3_9ACTN|nr:hypothetical protein [Micromonospora phaseoli]PZV91631.1 hypothetical protein CLV64_111150 [Micromonospora phaseoli]GIJ79262.1 hypothetical protein Xph01_36940 [Micromonospora phaseoli]SEJ91529.1 hypothetical protein SAMN05443287_11060 [Micromonospora phaseoli]
MSTLRAFAAAQALAAGAAQPVATVRHLHLSRRPLVLIPLSMAGEANAPLAAMVGSAPGDGRLLIVPQPRNRDQRFAFATELAATLLPYVDAHRTGTEAVSVDRGRDVRYRYLDAPQLLVPNPAGVTFLRLLGRSTRFRRIDGEYPVPPQVPLLGRWLTFFAERAEHPGSSALVAMTQALTLHWATGQSAVEDLHLPALLSWIAPPAGLSGAEAAARAEDPSVCPPAGPATDPEFDNQLLAPAIEAYAAADDETARVEAYAQLEGLLRDQLTPTWELMWRGLGLLRALEPGARVSGRWDGDRDAFTAYADHLADGGAPQPRRDGAVAAAARLHRLERAAETYAVQRAYDDPLVMAEHRLTGEAFVGEVVLADPTRVDDSGRRPVLRPRIQLVTTEPVLVPVGASMSSPTRPGQKARVVFVTPAADGKVEVVLELSGGMGRGLTATPGSVPEVGQRLCYTTLSEAYVPGGAFPAVEETPWTHGGPPAAGPAADSATDGAAGGALRVAAELKPEPEPDEEWA